ncbi:ROK family protein [Salinibacterium sp. PAMC 21357]|uniref:ROK family protein n=1 Tax=Salinibacterium sp. PAMC 21357 TaxID=1112215 RepID=UPI0002896954|nr:ROK family protein [Salinibacterium sp. PAMC 21357]
MNQSSAPSPSGTAGRGDRTRRHNLSRVLTLLHRGAQLRSQLTSQTGLNRSTIAALVAELAELGLAYESDPDPTRQVGRPSPMVNADARTVAIAINPEVDAITVGVVGLDGTLLKRVRYETESPPTVAEFVKISSVIIESLKGEYETAGRVVGVGVAVPGLVRVEDGLVRWAPHLEWRDEPVSQLLAAATGYPVWTANDASVGAFAEHIYGAGRGISDLIYLNGGASGIGGGIISDGRPLVGRAGYAGEFGHVRVVDSASENGTREEGSLETEVNRAALLQTLGLTNVDAETLDAALQESTDPAVSALVRRQLLSLSTSLRNAVNVLNPEVIVLGGFLSSIFAADPEFLIERVAAQSLEPSFEAVQIVPAQLGSDLLMIGAGELAFAPLLDDPSAYCAELAGSR